MMQVGSNELANHPLIRLLLDNLDDTGVIPEPAVQWVMDRPLEAQPFLLSLARAATLRAEHALGEGNLPALAIYLLSCLNEPSTVEPLLDILDDIRLCMPEAMHRQPLWDVLVEMGDIAVEPTLRYFHRNTRNKPRRNAAMLLGQIQPSHPRVIDVLIDELPRTPCTMAAYLASVGDERALPHLHQTFDACSANATGEYGSEFPGQPLFDLYDAIAECSGQLSAKQRRKYEQAWRHRYGSTPPVLIPRSERNPAASELDEPMQITACDLMEFCQKALDWYGTVRRASLMIHAPPALIWQFAYVQAN